MRDFAGKLAVITGGGTGMGRELARQLVAQGCDVAICDVLEDNMAETIKLCQAEAPQGILVTAHKCDVSNEEDVNRFRDEVVQQHNRDHINLLFNNAGIGSGVRTGSAHLTSAGMGFTTVHVPLCRCWLRVTRPT